jgi:putative ABC transport system permease protein
LGSLKDRKYELAIMRTMGAGRFSLFALIQLEGLILSVSGFVCGFLLSRLGMWLFSNLMEKKFNYSLSPAGPEALDAVVLAASLFVGLAASLLPAIRASRTPISETLNNE